MRMIWYFLAGWISGAVGMVLFAGWWIRKHAVPVPMDEIHVEPEKFLETLKNVDFETYKKIMGRLIEIDKKQNEGHTANENVPGDPEGWGIPEPDRGPVRDGDLGRSPEQRVDDTQSCGSNAQGR